MDTPQLKQEIVDNVKLALSKMHLASFESIFPDAFPSTPDEEQNTFIEESGSQYIPDKPIEAVAGIFNRFIEAGDSELIITEGTCHSCYKGQLGLRLTGKTSGKRTNYVLAFNEQEEIIAFQFCNFMACGNEAETEEFKKRMEDPF